MCDLVCPPFVSAEKSLNSFQCCSSSHMLEFDNTNQALSSFSPGFVLSLFFLRLFLQVAAVTFEKSPTITVSLDHVS